MNPFARFAIERLSPSSLNCWRDTPGLWCLRYLAGVKDESNAAMNRGTATERGMEQLLRGGSLNDAIGFAEREYEKYCFGEVSDDIAAEAKLMPGMLSRCFDWLEDMRAVKKLPALAATQLKVQTWLDGVSVPVIGYVDFTFMEGADLDLKTTKQCPSKPRPDHIRQIALYWKARQRSAALLYVTDKRHAYYVPAPAELRDAIEELAAAGRSLERFLSVVPDAETAIRSMPHPTDHYAYGAATKAKLLELSEAF